MSEIYQINATYRIDQDRLNYILQKKYKKKAESKAETWVTIGFYQTVKQLYHAETFNAYIYTITKHEVLNLIRSKLKDHNFRDQLYLYAVAEEYQFQRKLEFDYLMER